MAGPGRAEPSLPPWARMALMARPLGGRTSSAYAVAPRIAAARSAVAVASAWATVTRGCSSAASASRGPNPLVLSGPRLAATSWRMA